VLFVAKAAAAGANAAVPGPLVVGDGVHQAVVFVNANDQLSDTGGVTINAGSELDFNNVSETIPKLTFNGGAVNGPIEGGVIIVGGTLGFTPNNGLLITNANSSTASLNDFLNLNGAAVFNIAQ